MAKVESDIEVDVPLSRVYNQWTQFEEFPQFMEGVEEVRQIDPRRLMWRVEVAGRIDEWEAEIHEQVPDQVIAWHSISGRGVEGEVTFRPAGEDRTHVHLDMTYDDETWAETIGDALGLAESRVEGDLERFKEFIESRGEETGAWRGEIHSAEIREGHPVVDDEQKNRPTSTTGTAGASKGRESEVGDEQSKTHEDPVRERAEERQREPGGGSAPGGGPEINPNTGEPRIAD